MKSVASDRVPSMISQFERDLHGEEVSESIFETNIYQS